MLIVGLRRKMFHSVSMLEAKTGSRPRAVHIEHQLTGSFCSILGSSLAKAFTVSLVECSEIMHCGKLLQFIQVLERIVNPRPTYFQSKLSSAYADSTVVTSDRFCCRIPYLLKPLEYLCCTFWRLCRFKLLCLSW